MSTPTELSWEVNGLRIAGLQWGEPGQRPLLALHGWLDNAASFAPLAPLLAGYHVVALDLTGHGHSDWRSADSGYQIWDDLPEILGVVEQLGWDHFDLLGHSRGAIISSLLAAVEPQRVAHLVLLDAIMPPSVEESEFPAQLRAHLKDKQRLLRRRNRIFDDIEEAVILRQAAGLTASAAQLIAGRNLQQVEEGVRWTTDPRLRGASAAKLTRGQVEAVLGALEAPVLVLLADQGYGGRLELEGLAVDLIPGVIVERVVGGHHFHMEENLESLAARLLDFLQQSTPGEG